MISNFLLYSLYMYICIKIDIMLSMYIINIVSKRKID